MRRTILLPARRPASGRVPSAVLPGLLSGVLATAVAGALLAGCGTDRGAGGEGDGGPEPIAEVHGTGPVASPTAAGDIPRGKGSADPDDVNGDGHRDLLVPAYRGTGADRSDHLAVVFGTADGLDPGIRTVYSARDLDLSPQDYPVGGYPGFEGEVVPADLDSDGYPDFVSVVSRTVSDEEAMDTNNGYSPKATLRIAWGGPAGPRRGAAAARIHGAQVGAAGLDGPVRGDFDGDGHHDLAALRQGGEHLLLMYGPFSRSGVPSRTDTRPGTEGWLAADAIDPTGARHATALLLHEGDDGEQAAGTLFRIGTGSGLAAKGERVRKGNAVAFGDFDGDGTRDLAIGDNGSRNNEPGYETEAPGVDRSFSVYPGNGDKPHRYRIPGSGNSYYGPGDYSAADPDGDGRDALVVSTDAGAVLIDRIGHRDGEKRTRISRTVPPRMDGRKVGKDARAARPYTGADFDGDGKDELIFHWGADALFDLYGELPTHWWITAGVSPRDRTTFSVLAFTGEGG